MYQQTISDKLQGVIRNPFVFYFPIQRGFSGSIQTLPTQPMGVERDPLFILMQGNPLTPMLDTESHGEV